MSVPDVFVVVDGALVALASTRVNGRDLRRLAHVPDDQLLYLESPGLGEDVQVTDGQVFDPPRPLRFFTAPKAINGG